MRFSRAMQHLHRAHDDWKQVAWSDKSSFQLYRADGRICIYKKQYESMDSASQLGTISNGGGRGRGVRND